MVKIEEEIINDKTLLEVVSKYEKKRESLIPILIEIKNKYGWISPEIVLRLGDIMEISPSEIYGVITFYAFIGKEKKGKYIIRLCRTLSCDFAGKEKVAKALKKILDIDFGETTKDNLFSLEWTNCLGMCDLAPAMLVNDWIFVKVTPDAVKDIIEACKKNSGRHPLNIEEVYKTHDKTKYNCLTFSKVKDKFYLENIINLQKNEIIEVIRDSSLRGRGGAGFPTGVKWNLAAAAVSDEKYVVCNADEGEPGTFKDRVILMEWPELVIDGMTIGAYVIGAKKGFLYLRGEYTLRMVARHNR